MKTVLIVEDNSEIRENTTELLELQGYKVFIAENGRDGIRIASESKPDIILCDIMMPEVKGYEVLKQIRNNPATSSIPLIYVTASGEKNEVRMAMEMGANGYVRKPFDISDLMGVMDQCLKP